MAHLVERDLQDLAQLRSESFERDPADRRDLGIESGPPAQDAEDELPEEILLARGASRTLRDKQGKSALDLAADQTLRDRLAAKE